VRLRNSFLALAAITVACCLPTSLTGVPAVHATPVSFTYAGVVSLASDPLEQTFPTGTTFTAVVTFESTSPDSVPDVGSLGLYLSAISSAFVDIGGLSYSSSGGRIEVHNTDFEDGFLVLLEPIDGPRVQGLAPARVQLNLDLGPPSLFSSDALLVTAPDLAEFGNPFGFFDFFDTSLGFGFIALEITSLTGGPIQATPMPATLMLIGVSLAVGAHRLRAVLTRQNQDGFSWSHRLSSGNYRFALRYSATHEPSTADLPSIFALMMS
jgi:hypothetical protein